MAAGGAGPRADRQVCVLAGGASVRACRWAGQVCVRAGGRGRAANRRGPVRTCVLTGGDACADGRGVCVLAGGACACVLTGRDLCVRAGGRGREC